MQYGRRPQDFPQHIHPLNKQWMLIHYLPTSSLSEKVRNESDSSVLGQWENIYINQAHKAEAQSGGGPSLDTESQDWGGIPHTQLLSEENKLQYPNSKDSHSLALNSPILGVVNLPVILLETTGVCVWLGELCFSLWLQHFQGLHSQELRQRKG